jgi:hypothetical protein
MALIETFVGLLQADLSGANVIETSLNMLIYHHKPRYFIRFFLIITHSNSACNNPSFYIEV